MSIQHFYTMVADVERLTREDDSVGTWKEVWTVIHSNVACCIQPRKGYEYVTHDKKQSDVTHVMYTNPIEVRASDRVVMTDPLTSEVVEFEVIDSRNIDYLGRFISVDLKRIHAN